jgi:hypothetical protein
LAEHVLSCDGTVVDGGWRADKGETGADESACDMTLTRVL